MVLLFVFNNIDSGIITNSDNALDCQFFLSILAAMATATQRIGSMLALLHIPSVVFYLSTKNN